MSIQNLIKEGIDLFKNKKFDEAITKLSQASGKIENKDSQIQEQNAIQFWLGRCYFEQAIKTKGSEAEQLFKNAVKCYQLREELSNKMNEIFAQVNAQYWLGRCYSELAFLKKKPQAVSEAQTLVKEAGKSFSFVLCNLSNLNKDTREKRKVTVFKYFKRLYFCTKDYENYFQKKKQQIQEKLFSGQNGEMTDTIATILTVLNIQPIELGSVPLAHYTSPSVCEKLFGIVNTKGIIEDKEASLIRISSSTYMNDPTEGEGLLELLNLQDLELENKVDCPDYNAFFTCFSSRINDLNQFRLYGKENGVEASGCCLVFNKNGNWLREPDASSSFCDMAKKEDGHSGEQPTEADISDADLKNTNLPLYQVAYIAYYDKYIAKDKCIIWFPDKKRPKIGIRLKPVGKNPGWHKLRIRKLKEALIELMDKSNDISDKDRKALEYIRYLFKDFAFRDEEEFRLLKIEKIGSDKIEYCETTQSIYLPYADADARDIVDEVILGTNYEKSGKGRKAEAFQHLMRKHYPNIKVSRSSLPINANPPIKKD